MGHRSECTGDFLTRQRGTDAYMSAHTKCQMTPRFGPVQIDLIRVSELVLVAIRRAKANVKQFTLVELHPRKRAVMGAAPEHALSG